MDNPYIGTEWEQSWQRGRDNGLDLNGQVAAPPDDLDANHMTVYDEGRLAGLEELSARADEGTSIDINPAPVQDEAEGGHIKTWITLSLTTAEMLQMAGELAMGTFKKGALLFTAVDILIDICIPSGAPPVDLSDPSSLSAAMTSARESMGAAELFMAFCESSEHSAAGDQVTSAGYWHSNAFTDFWAALPVTTEHLTAEPGSLGRVGIVHVTSDSSGAEWIELT